VSKKDKIPKPPTWREVLPSRLRYYRDRARRRWRIVTFRCPACPKGIRGAHKFGCSLHGKHQTVTSMVRRSREWDDPDG